MSKYKILRGADGSVKAVGPNVDEFQPHVGLGDILEYSDDLPTPSSEELFATLRAARDARLMATDKYMLSDYPISETDLAAVRAYRAALRDLPGQPGAPWDGGGEATPWPIMPKS